MVFRLGRPLAHAKHSLALPFPRFHISDCHANRHRVRLSLCVQRIVCANWHCTRDSSLEICNSVPQRITSHRCACREYIWRLCAALSSRKIATHVNIAKQRVTILEPGLSFGRNHNKPLLTGGNSILDAQRKVAGGNQRSAIHSSTGSGTLVIAPLSPLAFRRGCLTRQGIIR
jgi:hypothetical protein